MWLVTLKTLAAYPPAPSVEDAAKMTRIQAEIISNPLTFSSGHQDADVVIISFFDYQCEHCKEAYPLLHDFVQHDDRVRIVYVNYPFIGRGSFRAGLAVEAAREQKLAEALHDALLRYDDSLDDARILDLATLVGLDPGALIDEMARREKPMLDQLPRVAGWFEALQLEGTPVLIIGQERLHGALERATLKAAVSRARQAASDRRGSD